MFPPNSKLMPGPSAKDPIFKDANGGRRRWLRRLVLLCLVGMIAWVAIGVSITLPPNNPNQLPASVARTLIPKTLKSADPVSLAAMPAGFAAASSSQISQSGPDVLGMSPCMAPRRQFGSAIAAPSSPPKRVFAFLPDQPVSAYLSLQRNCAKIDVLLPEWYEIGGNALEVARIIPDPEMQAAVNAILADNASSPLLMPVIELRYDVAPAAFAAQLTDSAYRTALVSRIAAVAQTNNAVGVCLRLEGVQHRFAPALEPLFRDLRKALTGEGKALCLQTSLDDGLWRSAALVEATDHLMVTLFQEPWRGSVPGPLAAEAWFRSNAAKVLAAVGREKLTIAMGGHAVDWISGQAIPERISFAEAADRIARAGARIDFSPSALNSYSSFLDENGQRHQIWMLDAVSMSNNLRTLDNLGITNLGFASMGEEEPTLWSVIDSNPDLSVTTLITSVPLPDSVTYSGTGPFYRFAQASITGRRDLVQDAETGLITGQTYRVVPQPVQMERYGNSSPLQVALTFDDGPDPAATSQILDVLRDHKATATFFVVGSLAMSQPGLLRRAVAEGHVIGSHTFFHPRMDTLTPFHALLELNTARNVIEGITGRTPRLYRAPYERGPGPITEYGAQVFSILADEGYSVAGSDIVPPDWSGISAAKIVNQVLSELDTEGGNVIVLHDGRSAGMHTAEAVASLIPALRERGYEIVPLPTLLGTTVEAMMPKAAGISQAFKGASITAISGVAGLLVAAFWLALMANFVRSLLYLFLAARREPAHFRPLRVLPSVTVVVPAYNEEKVIVQTVRNVLRSQYPGLKCVVVDDGSTDSTLGLLKANFAQNPQVTILTQRNQGKWQALNAAYAVIETEIAVCVDADTLIAPDAVHHVVQPFVDSKVGAVAGTVVVANCTNLLTKFQSLEYIISQQIARRAQEYLNGILVVPGALGAWRVDAVKDVGLYSNETLTEDADMTIWMRRGGYKVAYAEAALAFTEAPADIRSFMKQRLRWSFGNLQTLWKHRGAMTEFGPKRLFSMLDMIVFGYVLPLVAPIMDLIFITFAVRLGTDWWSGKPHTGFETAHYAVLAMLAVPLMDLIVGWVALRRDGRHPLSLLMVAPAMNYLYRPLLYITVYRALLSAITGRIASWNKLRRTGITVAAPSTPG